jgi:predicted AAA+ superfamily ATPase
LPVASITLTFPQLTRLNFQRKWVIKRLWIRGDFPESLLAQDDAASMNWRRSFIRSHLERDVPMFAPRLPAESNSSPRV